MLYRLNQLGWERDLSDPIINDTDSSIILSLSNAETPDFCLNLEIRLYWAAPTDIIISLLDEHGVLDSWNTDQPIMGLAGMLNLAQDLQKEKNRDLEKIKRIMEQDKFFDD